jgi:hypothetical protein
LHTITCNRAELRSGSAGSVLAAPSLVLFALFVISVLVTVGLAIYAGSALIGVRQNKVDAFSVPPTVPPPDYSPFTALPSPPPVPVRVARGTTPPPVPTAARAPSPNPPGVISNREDATDPDVPVDARFSVRRSRPRL